MHLLRTACGSGVEVLGENFVNQFCGPMDANFADTDTLSFHADDAVNPTLLGATLSVTGTSTLGDKIDDISRRVAFLANLVVDSYSEI